ncbi:hypothetical protein SY88_03485 [Clostridiales bacterium PH28_bin88]|nr:hypothetical protein SY88_03485 [Clostridiales bacterium PH28_bin88]
MRFTMFMMGQGLLFALFLSMAYLLGNAEETGAIIAINALTFIPASWIITLWIRGESHLLVNVLSVTLSFNLVTYLLQTPLGIPWPSALKLALDFVLVAALTLMGIYLGMRWPKREES